MTKEERAAFLADVHVGVLAVDEPGRGPLSLPIWYLVDGEVGAPDPAAGQPDAVEGLWAGDLVGEVEIDVEQVGLAGGAAHHVLVPHLLRERFGHGSS